MIPKSGPAIAKSKSALRFLGDDVSDVTDPRVPSCGDGTRIGSAVSNCIWFRHEKEGEHKERNAVSTKL